MSILRDLQDDEWRWPHFLRSELSCRSTGECRMDPNFLDRLEALREEYGEPMTITSGYRAPAYNAQVSTTGEDGPHTHGRAVDILVRGTDAYRLVGLAQKHGFTGIGVKQSGVTRFLHIDDLMPADGFVTRPWLWSY